MFSIGIAPQVVMKFTGHADYKSMKPYIDIADWLIRWKQAPDTMTLPADTTDTAGPAGTGAE